MSNIIFLVYFYHFDSDNKKIEINNCCTTQLNQIDLSLAHIIKPIPKGIDLILSYHLISSHIILYHTMAIHITHAYDYVVDKLMNIFVMIYFMIDTVIPYCFRMAAREIYYRSPRIEYIIGLIAIIFIIIGIHHTYDIQISINKKIK